MIALWLSVWFGIVAPAWGSGACRDLFAGATLDAAATPAKASRFFEVVPSGRDAREIEILRRFVHHIEALGGVLDRLGLPRTSQIVEFMEGRFLNALVANGRWPVGHFQEGARIIQQMSDTRSYVFEIVLPGPDVQHGFYRDDTPLEQQISIVLHVIGHNVFAKMTGFSQYRATQLNREAYRLDQMLQNLYVLHDKRDVENWFFLLDSMRGDQDFATGVQSGPEEFRPQSAEDLDPEYFAKTARGQRPVARHPSAPTGSVLQAFVANIPAHFPQWKKDMALAYERLVRYQTGLVQTQIMNEGFASFLQPFLIEYTEWNSFEHQIEMRKVMHAGRPQFGDPYWLGYEAWHRLWERFQDAKENKGKDKWRLGREFLKYAVDEFIATKNDADFLREALDAHWVSRNGFSILRPLGQDEWDPQLPDPPRGRFQRPTQYQVVTRDPRRVVDSVIRKYFHGKFVFRPQPRLYDFSFQSSGVTGLVLDDEFGRSLPLEKKSAAQKLYLLAQLHHRPVSLVARFRLPPSAMNHARTRGGYPPQVASAPDEREDVDTGRPFRLIVHPNGRVEVFEVKVELDVTGRLQTQDLERGPQELVKEFGTAISNYAEDLHLEDSEALGQMSRALSLSAPALAEVVASAPIVQAAEEMQLHAPAMGRAVEEYKTKVRARLDKALARALQGRGGIARRPGQVGVKVLPSIPYFQYERGAIESLFEEAPLPLPGFFTRIAVGTPPARGSSPYLAANVGPVHADDAGDSVIVNPGPLKPGDRFWGEGRPRSDSGDGDGDGLGRPGSDPDEGDGSWVYLSEDFYARLLGERVSLPRLNPKRGPTTDRTERPGGIKNNPVGSLLHRESLVEAYKLGVGMKGEDDDNDDSVGAAIQRGLEYMQRQDFRSDWKVEKTKPDINAVVTVVLDGSGSTAPYLKLLRGMVFDLRMLMKANYPRVRFEFVMFSGDARRFKEEEEEEFWQSFPGGGTNYQAGWETALSTLDKEYPRANWDRYLVTAGDFEDFGDVRKVGAFYDKILDEIEFHANVMVGARGQPDLWKWVLDRSRRDERVGSVDLTGRAAATIGDFRKLLKNPEN